MKPTRLAFCVFFGIVQIQQIYPGHFDIFDQDTSSSTPNGEEKPKPTCHNNLLGQCFPSYIFFFPP